MRIRAFAAVAAATAAAGVLTLAPAASAESSPPGCPKGYFCLFSGYNQTGSIVARSQGDLGYVGSGAKSYFNNGTSWPGADHIQLKWHHYDYGDRFNHSRCIHFNPGPGSYKGNFHDSNGVTFVDSATWRGEC